MSDMISTSTLAIPTAVFLQPPVPGLDALVGPVFCFLIQHPSGRSVLFDLGTRKDWENLAPAVVNGMLKQPGFGVHVEKNVSEILEEGDVTLTEIEAIIWSHWHYDHIGDPSTFPAGTALVVGPGFKEAFMPGYPVNKEAPVSESDFA